MSQVKTHATTFPKQTEPARHLEQASARQPEQGPVQQVVPQAAYRRALVNGDGMTASDLLVLQRALGNQAVGQLAAGGAPKAARQLVGILVANSRLAPPPKRSKPITERIAALREWLTAHVAGHALAVNTYTFYEVIDDYLGPWGSRGYPMAYGKRYNILFTTNRTLMNHPKASAWVWKTTILLQQALVEYIVDRYIAGTLGKLTEAELRAAAFASHPEAYTKGGLAIVSLVAPELIPEIASIPSIEFVPGSENFGASVEQVITTGAMVVPQMLGALIAAAMPAHSGILRIAVQRDRQRFLAEMQLNRYLIRTKQAIADGQLNNIGILNQITQQLLSQEFPNQDLACVAREVIQLANQRKTELAQSYAKAITKNPKLRAIYDQAQPGWEAWLRP